VKIINEGEIYIYSRFCKVSVTVTNIVIVNYTIHNRCILIQNILKIRTVTIYYIAG